MSVPMRRSMNGEKIFTISDEIMPGLMCFISTAQESRRISENRHPLPWFWLAKQLRDPSIENPKVDPEAIRQIRCQGVLDKHK